MKKLEVRDMKKIQGGSGSIVACYGRCGDTYKVCIASGVNRAVCVEQRDECWNACTSGL